jgi:hypothetical protein
MISLEIGYLIDIFTALQPARAHHDGECPPMQMLEKRSLSSTIVNQKRGAKGVQRLIEESASPIRSPDWTIEFALLTVHVVSQRSNLAR